MRGHALLVDLDDGHSSPPLALEVEQWKLRHGTPRPVTDVDAVVVEPELAATADLALHACLPSSARQADNPHNGCGRLAVDNVGTQEAFGPA